MLTIAMALAADPTVELKWRSGLAELRVTPPAGEHVNLSAPARWTLGDLALTGTGAFAGVRLPMPAEGGVVSVEVPLCADDDSACRLVSAYGTVDGRKAGTLRLEVGSPATERAAPQGRVVKVYDFGAVWCPPCNRMRAEVVDAPEHATLMHDLGFEVIDVDRPDSWPLKERYAVGGYPTLVAVDAAGNEVDRYVGYESEASLLAWCAGLSSVTPLPELAAGPPPGTSPELAGATALRLARVQREDDAKRWLAAAGDVRDAQIARLTLGPDRAAAEWLLKNDPLGSWAPLAVGPFPDLWPRLAPAVALAAPDELAAALDAWATTAPPDAALAARIGVLGTIRARLTGDPAQDRGFIVDYTDVLAATGNLAEAMKVLDDYASTFPGEFTFHFAASRLLLDAGQPAEAERRARLSLDLAWGDQRLRAVHRLARALDALGRRPEALAALDAELAATVRPAADQKVRTHRYIGEAEKLAASLRAAK